VALPTNVELLFGESPTAPKMSAKEVSIRFDELMKAVENVKTRTVTRQEMAGLGEGQPLAFNEPNTAYGLLEKAMASPEIIKGLSADALASLQGSLAGLKDTQPDLVKDLTLTSPLTTGLVAFDLEQPAKLLTPRPTPLRNRVPRSKGIGTSHRFKTISGFTGTQTGGVANLHPGIADTTQTNFAVTGSSNSLYYHRGPKISYAGFDTVIPYAQFSVSDEVTWSAQFSGQGYQDIRQLSRTSLLYSSMLLEERMILMGRGTATGFSGAMAAPTGVSVSARAAGTGETAITGFTTAVWVKVTSDAGAFGESAATAAFTVAVSSGNVVDVKFTDSAQALGYNVYIGTGASDPGDAARWFMVRSPGLTLNAAATPALAITLQGALPTSGKVVPAADSSAYAAGYDGMLAYCMGANSGYTSKLNGVFSKTNPGVEFQNAFSAMYAFNKADPDAILLNGADRKQLSDTLKGNAASNYKINLSQDDVTGVTLGDVVVGLVNEITGKRVDLEVNPWLPQGVAPIISWTLPIPDTQVSNVWEIKNVQDLMGIDWPVLQFAYESSSYWYGTALCYAPGWNACISGITAA
jgi:hypothetical protein